jgi:hypothetical protein
VHKQGIDLEDLKNNLLIASWFINLSEVYFWEQNELNFRLVKKKSPILFNSLSFKDYPLQNYDEELINLKIDYILNIKNKITPYEWNILRGGLGNFNDEDLLINILNAGMAYPL